MILKGVYPSEVERIETKGGDEKLKNKMKNINLKRGVGHVKKGVKTTVATAAASATLLAFVTIPSFTIELIESSTPQAFPKFLNIQIDSVDKNTGDFTGEVLAENRRGEVWEVAGTIEGSRIEFELENLSSAERIIATGELNGDGAISGIAADTSGIKYEWETTDEALARLNGA